MYIGDMPKKYNHYKLERQWGRIGARYCGEAKRLSYRVQARGQSTRVSVNFYYCIKCKMIVSVDEVF